MTTQRKPTKSCNSCDRSYCTLREIIKEWLKKNNAENLMDFNEWYCMWWSKGGR